MCVYAFKSPFRLQPRSSRISPSDKSDHRLHLVDPDREVVAEAVVPASSATMMTGTAVLIANAPLAVRITAKATTQI